MEDIIKRLRSPDRYRRAGTVDEKRVLIDSMEKARDEYSIAALIRDICSKREVIDMASRCARFCVWNHAMIKKYGAEEDLIMQMIDSRLEFKDHPFYD